MLTVRSQSKTFHVDYSKSWFDVCKDFVSFAITQSCSLDILCRPWAPGEHCAPPLCPRPIALLIRHPIRSQ